MITNPYLRKTAILSCMAGLFLTSCTKKDDVLPVETTTASIEREANLTNTAVSLKGSSLELGINGHPLGTAPYTSTPATKQIQLLKDMNMTWYRVDVQSMPDGGITVPHLWEPLKAAAINGGVKILPMLYPRTLDLKVSLAESYRRGKILGSNFAAKYGSYFTHYNLGNELEMKCLYPNKSGESYKDYDLPKFAVIAAYLKGMDEGIKSKDPGAKTMIDASWLHYGYLKMLERCGVKFDIIAYHWYSEMEGAAAGSMYKIPDISLKLSSMFSKPIWFTEINTRYKKRKTEETDQNNFVTKFIKKCQNNPQVEVVMVYELFDEPQKAKNMLEANYGIYKWTLPYTSYDKKLVVHSLTVK